MGEAADVSAGKAEQARSKLWLFVNGGEPAALTVSESLALLRALRDSVQETAHSEREKTTIARESAALNAEEARQLESKVQELTDERDEKQEALQMIRDAWNQHMRACTHVDANKIPTWEQMREWAEAPSDTASALHMEGCACALNKGAVHCFHCHRNWPPDETWDAPVSAGQGETPMFSPRILLFKRWLIYRRRRDYRAFGVTLKRGWKFRRVG